MQRTKPPFRADFVGSFLRPEPLKEARAAFAANKISADDLRAVEDREIIRLVGKLEEIGLKDVTDGEFRRSWWHNDFLAGFNGVDIVEAAAGTHFQGVNTRPRSAQITGKISYTTHPMLAHFKFLKEHAKVMPKMTIPSPSVLHFRRGYNSIKPFYPDIEAFFADVSGTYARVVKDFYDAGCRYLQFDDTVWANICSPKQLATARERGDDPDKLQGHYANCINAALAAKPADMTVTMHSCRGNFRSSWVAEGGYEPVAQVMFNDLDIDGFFLEYDTDRAGDFTPLRLFPKDKILVLGLVTSKTGDLEPKDDIKRRIDEATRYVDLDRLCLSPQCGFASTEEGNILTEDQQWRKLGLIVEIADEVWGS